MITWQGNWCHFQAAKELIREHQAVCPEGLLKAEIPVGWTPSDFDRWVVDYYVDTVISNTPLDWAIEVENYLLWEFDSFVLAGHQDYLAISPEGTSAYGADLKRGSIPVEPAENNWQVSAYAALLKLNFPSLEHLTYEIIQPLNSSLDMDKVSSVTLEREQLDCLPGFIEDRIQNALSKPYDLETGTHCVYCPANKQCPALKEHRDQMKKTITKEELDKLKENPEIDELAEWALFRKMCSNLLDEAVGLLRDELLKSDSGRRLVGEHEFFVVTNSKKTIPSELHEAAWDIVVDHLDSDDAYKTISGFSKDQIINGLKKRYKIPKKSKNKEDATEMFDTLFCSILKETKVSKLIIR